MPSRLADAHIEAQARLRRLTEQAVANIWRDLPGYDRINLDQWLSEVVPVVLTSQRTSVALTEGYIASFLGRRPNGVDASALIGAGVRNGTPPETVYERPFVTLWTKLGEGALFNDAMGAAMARATSTAAMDVQLSMRATASAVQATDDGIYGYQRVADPGACTFCSSIDGAFVKSADAMPLHNNCGCGLEPLTAPRRSTTPPAAVAVHSHGELGPVLADPAHDFTSV